MLVYTEPTVAQNLQYAPRATTMDAARELALCISKGQGITADSTDKTPAPNGAALVAAKDAGASLSQMKACLRADDADRGRRANLETQAVEIHPGAPMLNGVNIRSDGKGPSGSTQGAAGK